MLPVSWLVVAVLAALLLTTWITFTLTRLDRLHARVDAAQAAMDAQLVRRAAALRNVATSAAGPSPAAHARAQWENAAQAALDAGPHDAARAAAENAVTTCMQEVIRDVDLASEAPGGLDPAAVAELREAAARVRIARRFYNDAVRDTRSLRARRLPRLFRMAGRRVMPEFFDIDDTLPTASPARTDDRNEDQR